MNKEDVIGEFLGRVLGRNPEIIGLWLDSDGWADVEDLLRRLQVKFPGIGRVTLHRIVKENAARFCFDGSRRFIRAQRGEPVEISLAEVPTIPSVSPGAIEWVRCG